MKKSVVLLVYLLAVIIMTNALADDGIQASAVLADNNDTQAGYIPSASRNWPPNPVPTPAPSSAVTDRLGNRTLKLTSPYMRGSDVRALQTMLNRLGFRCGSPDGIYGEKTKAAVKAYQRRNGLKADGVFGRRTRAVLREEYRQMYGR